MNNLKKEFLIIFSVFFILMISLGSVTSADVSDSSDLDQSFDLNSGNTNIIVNDGSDLNSQNFLCDSSDSVSLCETSRDILTKGDSSKFSTVDEVSSVNDDVYSFGTSEELSLYGGDSGSTVNVAKGDTGNYENDIFENMTFINYGTLNFGNCTFINTVITANHGSTLNIVNSKFVKTDLFNSTKAITSYNGVTLKLENNVFYNYFSNTGLINQNAAISYSYKSTIKGNTFTYDRFKVAMYIRLDGYPPFEINSSTSSEGYPSSDYYPENGSTSFWAILNRTYAESSINLDNVLINGGGASTTEGSIINNMIINQNPLIQEWLNDQIITGNINTLVNYTFVEKYLNETNKSLYDDYKSGKYNVTAEGYTIWWYVLKSATGTEDCRLHVDGVILPTLLFTIIKESVKAEALYHEGYANTNKTISNLKVNQTINGTVTVTISGNGYEKNYTDIKVVNGIVDDFTIELPDGGNYSTLVSFTPESPFYENTFASGKLTVLPYKTSISNGTYEGKPGEKVTVTVDVSVVGNVVNLPEGSVVLINGSYCLVSDGKVTLDLYFSDVGNVLNYTVVYGNSTNFVGSIGFICLSSTPYETFTVVEVSPSTAYPNVKRNITATISYINGNIIEGTATLYIDGKEYDTVNVNNGLVKFNVEISDLEEHVVVVKYNNISSNFKGSEGKNNFSVEQIPSTTIVIGDTVEYGDSVTINFTVTGDIPGFSLAGKMNVTIDNKLYSVDVDENGKANLTLIKFVPGEYKVTSEYLGNAYYLPSKGNSTVTVSKIATITNVNSSIVSIGDDVVLNIEVSGDRGFNLSGYVTVLVNGTAHNVAIDEFGKGVLNLTGLSVGNYDVTTNYLGNAFYLGSVNKSVINVTKLPSTVVVIGGIVEYGDDIIAYFNVSGISGFDISGNLTVIIGDMVHNLIVGADGQVSLNLTGLSVGNYDVTTNYLGNDYYFFSNGSSSVIVNKIATTTNISSNVVTIGDDVIVNVSVSGKPGVSLLGEVNLTIGDNNYTVAIDEFGNGVLNLSGLGVGELNVTGIYKGNEFYLNSTGLGNIIVNSIPDPVGPTPDTPVVPDVPVTPDTPVVPMNPDPVGPTPDTPVVPVTPDTPVDPITPDASAAPEEIVSDSNDNFSNDDGGLVVPGTTVISPVNSGIATGIVNLLTTATNVAEPILATGTTAPTIDSTNQQNFPDQSTNDLGIDFPAVIPMQADNSWATLFVGLGSVLGLTELKRREKEENKNKKDNVKKDYKKE